MTIVAALILLTLYAGIAAWMAVRAERRFARRDRLPMQWGLDGKPTWYAPRRVALAVVPGIPGLVLILAALSIPFPQARNVTDAQLGPVLYGIAVVGLAVFAGYLWMAARWDRAEATNPKA